MRAALGAGRGALRRTLLAESLVLCGAGAVLGVVLARPLVAMVAAMPRASPSARSRSPSIASVLWVGAGLAMAAAVLLAYVPRLPSPHAPAGLGLASGSVRITPGTNRRLRLFATTQIAFSFVLLAGAGMLLATLVALQTANTGYDMRQVLAFDIPTSATGFGDAKAIDLLSGGDAAHRRAARRRGRRGGQLRALARCRQPGSWLPVHRRRLHARGRRGESARADAHGRAWLLRRARRPDRSPAATSPTTTAAAASPWRSSARASRSGCSRTATR